VQQKQRAPNKTSSPSSLSVIVLWRQRPGSLVPASTCCVVLHLLCCAFLVTSCVLSDPPLGGGYRTPVVQL
jgi:hypothetical protein